MLSALHDDLRSRIARRPPRSLKQEYQEFLLQRIEEYKNRVSRAELLEIGDEAVRELEENAAGQYLLTEVLLLEHVDRIIARRLRLPAFPRWRGEHPALRAAPRGPAPRGPQGGGPPVRYTPRLVAPCPARPRPPPMSSRSPPRRCSPCTTAGRSRAAAAPRRARASPRSSPSVRRTQR